MSVALALVTALAWGVAELLMLRGARRLKPLGLARWLMVFGTVMILPVALVTGPVPSSSGPAVCGGARPLRARGYPRVLPGTEHRSAHDRVAHRRDEWGVRGARRDPPPGGAILAARHGGLGARDRRRGGRDLRPRRWTSRRGRLGRPRRRAPGRVHRHVGRLERTDRPRVVGGRLPTHRPPRAVGGRAVLEGATRAGARRLRTRAARGRDRDGRLRGVHDGARPRAGRDRRGRGGAVLDRRRGARCGRAPRTTSSASVGRRRR